MACDLDDFAQIRSISKGQSRLYSESLIQYPKKTTPLKIKTEAHLLTQNNEGRTDVKLMHFQVCVHCGCAFRREELEGRPNTTGIYPCSNCGIDGPLNVEIREAETFVGKPCDG